MKQKLLYTFLIAFLFQYSFSQTVTLDNTFGTDGKVMQAIAPLGEDFLNNIAIQPDKKILVCTLKDFTLNGTVIISRFNVDGTLDTSFGGDGIVETQLVSESGGNSLMKLQPDGKILITGSRSPNIQLTNFDFATMRYNSDGTIDTDFGTNGIVITDFIGTGDIGNAIDLQSDGKIIVAGYTYYNQGCIVSLIRYLSNGTIDTTFGFSGKLVLPSLGVSSYDYTNCIKITSDDSILIGADTTAGETNEDYTNVRIFRVTSNGNLDVSFNTTGSRLVDFGAHDSIGAIEEYNGKIVISGFSSVFGSSKIFLSRFLADGTPDNTFGVNGIAIGNRAVSNPYDAVLDMKVLNNGKLICTGYTSNNTNTDFLLIQFNTDGTMDTGFNSVGYFMTDFNNNTNDVSGAIDIGSDGKIVCVGLTDLNAIRITSLARYNYNELSNQFFATNSFSVYPNPFSESITIENEDINSENIKTELYDISGRKLSEYKLDGISTSIQMDQNLTKGNYLLKITGEGKSKTIQIVKK